MTVYKGGQNISRGECPPFSQGQREGGWEIVTLPFILAHEKGGRFFALELNVLQPAAGSSLSLALQLEAIS